MNRRVKPLYIAWYELRQKLGLRVWYHSTWLCHRHIIPRTHKVSFFNGAQPMGVLLCSKGWRHYFTDEPIRL